MNDFSAKLNALKSSYSKRGIELYTIPSDECPLGLCDGQGYLHYVDWTKKTDAIDNPGKYKHRMDEIEYTRKCECVKQQRINKAITSSGIPEQFKDAKVLGFKIDCYQAEHSRTVAEFAKKVAMNYVEKFEQIAQGEKSGLYFYSTTKGSGKTRLASSIANALIKVHKRNVLFLKASDISAQVRKTYQKNSEFSEDEVLKVFREASILVIDDLAVDDKTGYSEDLLGKILDYRMDMKAVTIITSNRTINDLALFYPKEIVATRVRKICYEVLMPEESIRDEESKQQDSALEDLLFGKK